MIKRNYSELSLSAYLIEIAIILCILCSVYLIIAWASYSPFDQGWSVATSQTEVNNKAGFLGAWIIDLCFSLFGQVAHFLPFLSLLTALLLLRAQWKDEFSFFKTITKLLGLFLLLCGLCVLWTLFFTNNIHYLAGGVLGSWLVAYLFPMLGLFGTFMLAFVVAVIGFLFNSGLSLIMLLGSSYRWLTEKYDENDDIDQHISKTDVVTVDELEPVYFPYLPQNETEQEVESATQHTDDHEQTESVAEIMSSEELIKHAINSQETILSNDINEFEEDISLINQSAVIVDENIKNESNAVDLPNFTDYRVSESIDLPKVSISTQPSNINTELESQIEENNLVSEQDDNDPLLAELAKQFELREQQKLAEMAERAKALGAEQAFEAILGEQSLFVSMENHVSNDIPNTNTIPDDDLASEKVKATSDYKPYENTLIHPLLQPKQFDRNAPKTPLPSLDLLNEPQQQKMNISREEINQTSQEIEKQLRNFNVKAKVESVLVGPVVTRYELSLEAGVKAAKVSSLDSDLARALMFRSIRVAEVIPGKPYIGIETPNSQRQMVALKEVLASQEFQQTEAKLPMALGKDISGQPVVVDLAKMPHLLVAGATGSGKSVGVNSMILSLLYKCKPEDVRFIMIDPKVVELSMYDDIPHLLTNVVTDMKKAANALRWCVEEMERRYQLLSALYVRNIEGFNQKIKEAEKMELPIPNPIWKPGDTLDDLPPPLEKMNYIVVVVDEFADLLMVVGKQVEELIARLAQKARAVGIHLILATQRPSVDVITGLIKANIPSRIAFTVTSKIDSRTILDQSGAEALLGAGDMLYSGPSTQELMRIHGAFMSDSEVELVANDWRARGKPQYLDDVISANDNDGSNDNNGSNNDDIDELFDEAVEYVLNTGTTSISAVQRNFKLGFNRAARIIEQMEAQGILSAPNNAGRREILAPKPNRDYN